MAYYEVMQVCLKGHQITARYNECLERRQDFCNKCGAKTIYKCSKCDEPIRGKYIIKNVIDLCDTPVPYNCHQCGVRYPWTTRLKFFNVVKSLCNPVKFLVETFAKVFKK